MCNYPLFLSEEGLLIGSLERASIVDSSAAMQSSKISERWQPEMEANFELPGSTPADLAMTPLPEVRYLM